MGDRVNIVTKNKDLAVYCHCLDGNLDAYLCYCYAQGFRCPERDHYGFARLCQVIANNSSEGLNVGITTYGHMCCSEDNGIITINGWHSMSRTDFDFNPLPLEGVDYSINDNIIMLFEKMVKLNSQMPEADRLNFITLLSKMCEWIDEEKFNQEEREWEERERETGDETF